MMSMVCVKPQECMGLLYSANFRGIVVFITQKSKKFHHKNFLAALLSNYRA